MFEPGDTLLIETNYNDRGEIQNHLFVIILKFEDKTKLTIIIPISTLNSPKQDRQTVLTMGCHEFINHESYVNYGRAKLISEEQLNHLITEGQVKRKSRFEEPNFSRICDGILKSHFTPPDVREHYQDYIFKKL